MMLRVHRSHLTKKVLIMFYIYVSEINQITFILGHFLNMLWIWSRFGSNFNCNFRLLVRENIVYHQLLSSEKIGHHFDKKNRTSLVIKEEERQKIKLISRCGKLEKRDKIWKVAGKLQLVLVSNVVRVGLPIN